MNVDTEQFADTISLGYYVSPKGYYHTAIMVNPNCPATCKVGLLRPIGGLHLAIRLMGISLKGLLFKK